MLPKPPGQPDPEELLALLLSMGLIPTEAVLVSPQGLGSSQAPPPPALPVGDEAGGLWVYIPPRLAERVILKVLKAALKSRR